jgi:hypothetical protein
MMKSATETGRIVFIVSLPVVAPILALFEPNSQLAHNRDGISKKLVSQALNLLRSNDQHWFMMFDPLLLKKLKRPAATT